MSDLSSLKNYDFKTYLTTISRSISLTVTYLLQDCSARKQPLPIDMQAGSAKKTPQISLHTGIDLLILTFKKV